MRLSLGFSPCPNDTFIFDALVHGKVDTEGLEFDVTLADVEVLNEHALEGRLDVTKLSYHALGYVRDRYALLRSGSALGRGVGPLLIARTALSEEALRNSLVAIPGKYTTANFLFRLAYPTVVQTRQMLFSDIEGAIRAGEVQAGVIIHENRFTYADRGFVKLRDLGEFWESSFHAPIPLGCIVAHRRLPPEVQAKLDRVLRRSVAYAQTNPTASAEYVRAHAQEMSEEVTRQHIELYVNDFTLELGEEGERAIRTLFAAADERGLFEPSAEALFVPGDK